MRCAEYNQTYRSRCYWPLNNVRFRDLEPKSDPFLLVSEATLENDPIRRGTLPNGPGPGSSLLYSNWNFNSPPPLPNSRRTSEDDIPWSGLRWLEI